MHIELPLLDRLTASMHTRARDKRQNVTATAHWRHPRGHHQTACRYRHQAIPAEIRQLSTGEQETHFGRQSPSRVNNSREPVCTWAPATPMQIVLGEPTLWSKAASDLVRIATSPPAPGTPALRFECAHAGGGRKIVMPTSPRPETTCRIAACVRLSLFAGGRNLPSAQFAHNLGICGYQNMTRHFLKLAQQLPNAPSLEQRQPRYQKKFHRRIAPEPTT